MEVDHVEFRELTETCRPQKKRLAECYTCSIRGASPKLAETPPSPPSRLLAFSNATDQEQDHYGKQQNGMLQFLDREGAAESSELIRQVLFSESFWKPAIDFHPTPVVSPKTSPSSEPRRRSDCR